jgi:hypothetical protein
LIVTGALLMPVDELAGLAELDEPPVVDELVALLDEQATARMPATARAVVVDTVVLRSAMGNLTSR